MLWVAFSNHWCDVWKRRRVQLRYARRSMEFADCTQFTILIWRLQQNAGHHHSPQGGRAPPPLITSVVFSIKILLLTKYASWLHSDFRIIPSNLHQLRTTLRRLIVGCVCGVWKNFKYASTKYCRKLISFVTTKTIDVCSVFKLIKVFFLFFFIV